MACNPIISRTPLRISFAGGGTDLPSFWTKEGGAVVGTAIDKYVYVVVKPLETVHRFSLRVTHGTVQEAGSVEEIAHPIVRAALETTGITEGVHILTFCDLPEGTGLGSSGSFTVGLLNALHTFAGRSVEPEVLAEESYELETARCGYHVGKQDQYFAALGGLRRLTFLSGGRVATERIELDAGKKQLLEKALLLVFSGPRGPAEAILKKQDRLTEKRTRDLRTMKRLAHRLFRHFVGDLKTETLGRILDEDWRLKAGLARGIANERIKKLYRKALDAGALGGKVLGAGGGGFFLFCVPPHLRQSVRRALGEYPTVDFRLEANGSRIWIVP